MRHPRVLVVVGGLTALLAAACSSTVQGAGSFDAAGSTLTATPTASTTSDSPTPTPTEETTTATPTPTPDVISLRRATCVAVIPSVSTAITTWNNYVDKKSGDKNSVAKTLSVSGTTIDGFLRNSGLTSTDPVKINGAKMSSELVRMSRTLRTGGTPAVDAFNKYKTDFQKACPK